MMMGVADFPIETLKLLNIHPDSRKGKGKAKKTEDETTQESSSGAGRETAGSSAAQGSGSGLPQTPNTPDPTTPRADAERSGFMAQAMAQSSQVSHSRSPSRDRGLLSPVCSNSRDPSRGRSPSIPASELRDKSGTVWSDRSGFSDKIFNMKQESIVGTGKGVGRIVGAGFKSPLDFSMNVAQGFHNVPKLYGGDVRQVDKVTNLQSGLKTAAKVSVSCMVGSID
jgi:hypothetical protein